MIKSLLEGKIKAKDFDIDKITGEEAINMDYYPYYKGALGSMYAEFKPTEFVIMNVIWEHTSQGRKAKISYDALALASGSSRSSVKRAIKSLCARGVLIKIQEKKSVEGKGEHFGCNEYEPSLMFILSSLYKKFKYSMTKINKAFKIGAKMLRKQLKKLSKLGVKAEDIGWLGKSKCSDSDIANITREMLEELGIEITEDIEKNILEPIALAREVNNGALAEKAVEFLADSRYDVKMSDQVFKPTKNGVIRTVKRISKAQDHDNKLLKKVAEKLMGKKDVVCKCEEVTESKPSTVENKPLESELSNNEKPVLNMKKIVKRGKALANNIGESKKACITLMEVIKSRGLALSVKELTAYYKFLAMAKVVNPFKVIFDSVVYNNGLGIVI